MSTEQLKFDLPAYAPTPEDILATPDTASEQLLLFDKDSPQDIWKSRLELHSPLANPLGIGSAEADARRFRGLESVEDRRFHLFNIYDEVGKMRCIRDTRIIYGVDLSMMAQLIGVNAEDLRSWEAPKTCQDPGSIVDEYGLIFDTMRLFVVLDELGYQPSEIKELIAADIKSISKMMQKGGYQKFIKSVDGFLPYQLR
jgi:hypothetical protein